MCLLAGTIRGDSTMGTFDEFSAAASSPLMPPPEQWETLSQYKESGWPSMTHLSVGRIMLSSSSLYGLYKGTPSRSRLERCRTTRRMLRPGPIVTHSLQLSRMFASDHCFSRSGQNK